MCPGLSCLRGERRDCSASFCWLKRFTRLVRYKGWGNRLHLLMGGAVKPLWKGHGYREGNNCNHFYKLLTRAPTHSISQILVQTLASAPTPQWKALPQPLETVSPTSTSPPGAGLESFLWHSCLIPVAFSESQPCVGGLPALRSL